MRKSLVRRGAAAALAVFTGLGAVALASSPAQAADVKLAGVTLSSSTVVLDGDAGCGNRLKVTFKVYNPASGDEEFLSPSVNADVVAANGDIVDILTPSQSSRSGNYVYYTDNVFLCGGLHAPGRYQVQTELTWWDENYDDHVIERSDSFSLQRPTSLTYNATPEPVKKGAKLTHSGQLKIDPVGYGAKKGAKGVTLKFYFKANGSKTYVYKGKTVTTANGKYNKKIKATKSGIWKVVYAGSSTKQPQTKYDTVKVKR
ncbi:hypothetical protein AB0F81_02950 [Actinoplanes sp. NPDC024001]|uniref:hypothetical protein n=1 Tax=Actinoplanes sp. NPDC024001 TaxID=3154598 RepID=UPI0033D4F7DE